MENSTGGASVEETYVPSQEEYLQEIATFKAALNNVPSFFTEEAEIRPDYANDVIKAFQPLVSGNERTQKSAISVALGSVVVHMNGLGYRLENQPGFGALKANILNQLNWSKEL